MISDVDAWKEMADYAFEAGMTAKKIARQKSSARNLDTSALVDVGSNIVENKARKGVEKNESVIVPKKDDELEELFARHGDIKGRLHGMERRYEALFKLRDHS
jgi:hypothetical protein